MRIYWLLWLLICVTAVAVTVKISPAKAEEVTIAQCNNAGLCLIQEDVLRRLVDMATYWMGQAKTCKAV